LLKNVRAVRPGEIRWRAAAARDCRFEAKPGCQAALRQSLAWAQMLARGVLKPRKEPTCDGNVEVEEMPELIRNHPSETIHRSITPEIPTQQATIEWILGYGYLAKGNKAMGVRHLLKSAVWLEKAGAPLQAQNLREEVEQICRTSRSLSPTTALDAAHPPKPE
jgi:hypothetical protein